jgi:hypothetical protein
MNSEIPSGCPITMSRPTKMYRDSFLVMCRHHQQMIRAGSWKFDYSRKDIKQVCKKCAVGKLVENQQLRRAPVGIEWIKVTTFE